MGPRGEPGLHATFPPHIQDIFEGSGELDFDVEDGAPGIPGKIFMNYCMMVILDLVVTETV